MINSFKDIDKEISFEEGVQKYFKGTLSIDEIIHESFIKNSDLLDSKLNFFSLPLILENDCVKVNVLNQDKMRDVVSAITLLMRFLKRIDKNIKVTTKPLLGFIGDEKCFHFRGRISQTREKTQGLSITPDNYWFQFEESQLEKRPMIQLVKDSMQMGLDGSVLKINDYFHDPVCLFEQIMFYEIGMIVGSNNEIAREVIVENLFHTKNIKKQNRCNDYLAIMGDE